MPVDFETIRKDIAIKHNVLLGKDDPILVTVSLNEMVLSHYLDLLSEVYSEHSRTLIQSFQVHNEQALTTATVTAEKVVTQATEHVTKEIKKAVHEAVSEAHAVALKQAASLNHDLKRQVNDQVATGSEARTARNIAIVAAMVAVIATLFAIFLAMK